MQSPLQSSTLDSLPKQFVSAMRTLFDIMDDKRSGYVNFADIENRWQDDGSKGLPKGVIESLRKVTPPNGMLSFERFCAGLKICLLRNQVEQRTHHHPLKQQQQQQQQQQQRPSSQEVIVGGVQTSNNTNRPPSAPLLDLDGPQKPQSWTNTAAIRPNNMISPQQRTISMPQLLSKNVKDQQELNFEKPVPNINKPMLYGPPKPPRSAVILALDRGGGGGTNSNLDRAEIRTALQNWQIGLMMNEQENKNDKRSTVQYGGGMVASSGNNRTGRSLGDGKAAPQQDIASQPPPPTSQGIYQKKANVRRREPRRHTLQNGIDYNMLKRMKQIEQEKDVLMQGLSGIEKAREWYLKQIAAVQEKMKYLGRMGHVEQWTEAQQERLELQRARVLEVNRHLAALTDSWERGGLPLHMNLAVHPYPQAPHHQDLSTRLKQQNHLLTEEVGKKSERITILEREKASLIRELLQMRAPNRNNQEEAVF